jgi:hypothetical protein
MRGLPAPYSWAPRYLARLTGQIIDGYTATEIGLVGYWFTFRLNRIIRHGEHKNETKLIFHMELLNLRGEPFEVWFELPHHWSDELDRWLEEATPSGTARLLCSKVPGDFWTNNVPNFPVTMLMVLLTGGMEDLGLGKVVGTAAMNDDDVTELVGEEKQWLLS